MVNKVTELAVFKEKRAPLVSHREAARTGGRLLTVLSSEGLQANDIIATLRFDCVPDDLAVIETFIGNLLQRIEDRSNARHRTDRSVPGTI